MHSCENNTGENVSHLEQMVNGFLPYSQQQLGFDKPVKIVLQSDPSNADVLLGKTAHYNPETFEVYIYTDKRHPKDIMRSLSHELVHHAQNCRGDFGSCEETGPGYAQRDPHLRKMEREAYTKGNLIFRDFEDLIKSGKIAVDINFKDSGEPQMSLKEWKDSELNTLLMKKWGLLKEGTAKEEEDEEGNRPSMAKDMDLDEEAGHPGQSCDAAHPGEKHPIEEDQAADAAKEREDGARALMALGGAAQASKRQENMSYRHGEQGEVDESHIDLARSRGQLHKAIPASEYEEADPFPRPGADRGHPHRGQAGYKDPIPDRIRQSRRHDNPIKALSPEDFGEDPARARAYGAGPRVGAELDPEQDRMEIPAYRDPEEPPPPGERVKDPRHLTRTTAKVPPVSGRGLEEGDPLMKLTPKGHRDTETSSDKRLDYEKDPAAHMTTDQALELGLSPDTVRSAVDWDPTAEHPDDRRDMRQPSRGGHQVGLGTARRRWRKAFAGQFKEGKISVREAKEITRRIIERIRKEGR